jgi:RND family efflux transporter MFP subunit
MSDRSELLDQLKIDRSADAPGGGLSAVAATVLALVACAAGAAATWFFLPRVAPATQVATTAAAKPRVATANSESTTPATSTAPVQEDRRILNASGYITARRIATVSSEIAGLITEVNVEEGMLVDTGQVLARLDNALALVDLDLEKARLASLRAGAERVEASLAEARRVYDRAENLRGKNLTSEADLTRSTADVDTLKADLKRAQADIEVSKLNIARQQERLQDHVIRAPFSGVVTVKNAQIGEIISPGSAGGGFTRTGICTIVDMDSLEIEVDVNEAFIGRVFAGQTVEAALDAYPEWDIPASVIAIIPTADRSKATVKVRIGINVSDQRILPDMGVKVAFLQD